MINLIKKDKENLTWFENPALSHPYLIIGYEGWPDAGNVSSRVLSYLSSAFSPILFAKLKPADFYSVQSSAGETRRPQAIIEKGIVKSLEMTTTSFGWVKDKQNRHDLMFIYGPEPELSLEKYVQIVINLVKMYKIEKIVAIGGTFAAIPHTIAAKVTASISHQNLKDEIKSKGIELTDYTGPVSIQTLLLTAAAKEDIPMINLWGHTPHYIQVPNTMGCYELLVKLDLLLDLKIDLEEARLAGERLYEQIDKAISMKPELQKFLKILEIGYRKDNISREQPINEKIVKEIERLLNEKLE
jgi:proteasome assembly chaperone (PAC2) family protein